MHAVGELAEAALHEKTGQGFFALMRRGEVDVPKVGARVKDVNGIEKVVRRVLVDLGDHAGAGFFPVVAIEVAAEMELLAPREFLREAKNTAVAASEQG